MKTPVCFILICLLSFSSNLSGQSRQKSSLIKDTPESPEMIYVPAGEFMMGSNSGEEDEKPVHKIILKDFYIGKYEVTQREWTAVMGTNPSDFPGRNNPVEYVNLNEVQEYLKKLSKLTGHKYRLPTEAEWEYACRAGSLSKYCFGNNPADLDEYGWHRENSVEGTSSSGQKKPNEWGLYDMHGNVWEWCQDVYGDKYYSRSPQNDPPGPSSGGNRVVRGGGWPSGSGTVRSAYRLFCYYGDRNNYIGFRCVREADTK